MTQATDYTKLTLSDRENTSNGELEHVILVMEDKESERNKVQNNRRKIAGIAAVTVLVTVLVISAVSSSEVHTEAALREKFNDYHNQTGIGSFHQLETQVANNATRLEHTVKNVDELKSNTDEKRKDLSKEVNRTDQNTKYPHKRFERVDKELENLYE